MKNLVILGLLNLFFFLPVNTQANLLVNGELTHEYQTGSGQYLSGLLEIQNVGTQTRHVQISRKHISPQGAQQAHFRSNRDWISLIQNYLEIPPGTTQHVSYNIAVPTGIQTGTYWSTIDVEPLQGTETGQSYTPPGQVTVSIRQRLKYSINIMTHIGQGEARLNFLPPQLAQNEFGQRVLQLGLENTGDFHSRPEVSLELFDAQGNRAATIRGNKRGLYPAAQKTFAIALADVIPGNYQALLLARDTRNGKIFGADLNLTIHP